MVDSIHSKALRALAENADNGIPLGDDFGIEAQALRNAAEYIDKLEAELKYKREKGQCCCGDTDRSWLLCPEHGPETESANARE